VPIDEGVNEEDKEDHGNKHGYDND